MSSNKHAYLIIAHNNALQLKLLLELLDHPRTDIYIHIDEKSMNDFSFVAKDINYSNVYFIPRIPVFWGGYSIVKTEILLLEYAMKNGEYAYYHLLSGADLPLLRQDKILSFFDVHAGADFISIGNVVSIDDAWFRDRVCLYYPLQESFSRSSVLGNLWRKISVQMQKIMRINRHKNDKHEWGIGTQFFDITSDFADYVVSNKDLIASLFKNTFIPDEIFLQYMWLNWSNINKKRFINNEENNMINHQYMNVLRAVDWNRGTPYIWRREDYDFLLSSHCLFARKFDWSVDSTIISMIYNYVCRYSDK